MSGTRITPLVLGFGATLGLSWFDGGFFPPSWGVAALGMLAALGYGLMVVDEVEISTSAIVSLAALTGFAIWTLASAMWTVDLTKTVLDAQLVALYPLALGTALLVASRLTTDLLAMSTLAGMGAICAYALSGRLFPDVVGFPNDPDASGRLYAPIGYWNGLAAFAALTVVLAIGVVASRRGFAIRAGAAVAVLAGIATLFLTFSRGGLLALAVGVA